MPTQHVSTHMLHTCPHTCCTHVYTHVSTTPFEYWLTNDTRAASRASFRLCLLGEPHGAAVHDLPHRNRVCQSRRKKNHIHQRQSKWHVGHRLSIGSISASPTACLLRVARYRGSTSELGVWPCLVMDYTVMAYTVMARIVTAFVVMSFIIMNYLVMTSMLWPK